MDYLSRIEADHFQNNGKKIKRIALVVFVAARVCAVLNAVGGILASLVLAIVFENFWTFILGGISAVVSAIAVFVFGYVFSQTLYSVGSRTEDAAVTANAVAALRKKQDPDFVYGPPPAGETKYDPFAVKYDPFGGDPRQTPTSVSPQPSAPAGAPVRQTAGPSAQASEKPAPVVVHPVAVDGETISCPRCNTEQRANRTVCFNCGARFN